MGIEKAREYGREVYRIKMLPIRRNATDGNFDAKW
jgi:hypothetical protein